MTMDRQLIQLQLLVGIKPPLRMGLLQIFLILERIILLEVVLVELQVYGLIGILTELEQVFQQQRHQLLMENGIIMHFHLIKE
jgi:hypothetical protein